jgi:hypothetical protein
MKFELKNNTLKNVIKEIDFPKNVKQFIKSKVETKTKELSLIELIENLNKEERLNPVKLSNKKIEILFEDFDALGKFIHNVKKIFSRTVGSIDIANYNIEDCKIRVYSDIFNPKFYNEEVQKSYDTILDNGDNNNFIVKFFILHEIGHSIHHNLLNDLNYKEFSSYFNNFDLNTNNHFKRNLSLMVRENFADLYATISLFVLEQSDNKLINKLEKVLEYRKSNLNEGYNTYNGLGLVLEKIKSNDFKIDSFTSIEG